MAENKKETYLDEDGDKLITMKKKQNNLDDCTHVAPAGQFNPAPKDEEIKRRRIKRKIRRDEMTQNICGFRFRCRNVNKKNCDVFNWKNCKYKKLKGEIK
jgi:hypothetical protein